MRWWPMAVAGMLAFAGCSGSPSDDVPSDDASGSTSDTSSSSGAASRSASSTSSGAPRPNRAPVLAFTVSNKTGTEPFQVNLTLNATDADGDALTWTLALSSNASFAANGTTFPANVTVLLAAGNHTFNATVSDGVSNDTKSLLVAVLPAVGGPWQLESGAIVGHAATCAAGPYDATTQGFVKLPINPLTIGLPYTVTLRAGSAYDGVVWLDASDGEISHDLLGITEGGWELSGTVPEGAAALALLACGNTFDETFVYHSGTPPVEIPPP